MAKGINKVILVGHLGQDPELRYTQASAAIANISIATTESWTDKQSGQRQDRTEWHRVVFFNRLAEIVGEYLRKGSQVYIEGSLRTRKWQDQQGQDRYTTEIVASEMQMLGGRGDNAGGAAGPASYSSNAGHMANDEYSQAAPMQAAPMQQRPAAAPNYAQAAPNYGAPQQPASYGAPQPAAQPGARPAPTPPPAPSLDSFDDDIPF